MREPAAGRMDDGRKKEVTAVIEVSSIVIQLVMRLSLFPTWRMIASEILVSQSYFRSATIPQNMNTGLPAYSDIPDTVTIFGPKKDLLRLKIPVTATFLLQ